MDIYTVDRTLTPHLNNLMNKLGIVDDMPYTIDQNNACDVHMNEFLHSLVDPSSQSPNTWVTYAEQLSIFVRYLHASAGGKHWTMATRDDIIAFWKIRCVKPHNGRKTIKSKSWKVFAAAAVRLYQWALENNVISQLPFNYKTIKGFRNSAYAVATTDIHGKGKHSDIKFIALRDLKNLVLPVLKATKYGIRNSLLVLVCISTGMRLSELMSLSLECVDPKKKEKSENAKTVSIEVIGKGNKIRIVKIPKLILKEIDLYVRTERADSVKKFKNRFPKKQAPTALFLTQEGEAMSNRSVQQIFADVAKKIGIRFHPHMLRHAYAIYTLSAMVRHIASVENLERSQYSQYGILFKDPIRILQRLMGHASILSTFIYLDYLPDRDDLSDQAIGEWDVLVGGVQ